MAAGRKPMKKIILALVALASSATLWGADRDILTPEPRRITDEAIAADIKVIKTLQGRLAELNKKGTPIASYHFAKAQAWLDFAMDAYTINDRSRAVEEALRQALDLIEPMEAGKKGISMYTAIIPTSSLVRTDLWEKAEKLKKDANFRCAEDKVAQLEVQLVWAGHEIKEFDWRHTKPYLQAAERLAREADTQIASCPPLPPDLPAVAEKTVPVQPVIAAAPMAPSRPGPAAPTPTEAAAMSVKCDPSVPAAIVKALAPLPDRIHFAFDRAEISSASFSVITRIAAAMNSEPTLRLVLYGHADQRGDLNYNMNLSRQRAENVRSRLVSAGIAADRIVIAPIGKIQPLTTERSAEAYARNRRVEFFFTMGPPQPVIPQLNDLQPEKGKRQ
jgi:outer membrane protein OmpA-like peptidoglycan-associated protein